jgi:O-antigen ligase
MAKIMGFKNIGTCLMAGFYALFRMFPLIKPNRMVPIFALFLFFLTLVNREEEKWLGKRKRILVDLKIFYFIILFWLLFLK